MILICVFTDCSTADLAHYLFIEIKYRYINQNNLYYLSLQLDDCKDKCTEHPECRAFEYGLTNGMCTGSERTLLTANPNDFGISQDHDITMYQKACKA